MRHAPGLALVLALAPLAAVAGEARPASDGPAPLHLRVGEALDLCRTGTVICPAVAPICDDPALVDFELSSGGLRFRGAKAGETLCSVSGSSGRGTRRVYRITVEK